MTYVADILNTKCSLLGFYAIGR